MKKPNLRIYLYMTSVCLIIKLLFPPLFNSSNCIYPHTFHCLTVSSPSTFSLSPSYFHLHYSINLKIMEDHIIKLIIVAVFSWTTLFLLIRKLLPNYSYEFCNRLVSTIHASLAVTLSLLSVQDWSCPVCPYASKSTLKQKQTLAITVGYLIYDSVCSHFDERSTSNLDNIIHHLVSIIGLGAGLAYQKCGAEMAATIFITEISSPFLHLRELLKELGYKDTDLNLAADVLFALIFSVARMVGGPYLAYVTLTADNPLLIKTMASGLQLVSAFWFYKILRMVKHKFTKRATMKKLA